MYIYAMLEIGKQTIYNKQTDGPKSQTFRNFKTSVDRLYGSTNTHVVYQEHLSMLSFKIQRTLYQ